MGEGEEVGHHCDAEEDPFGDRREDLVADTVRNCHILHGGNAEGEGDKGLRAEVRIALGIHDCLAQEEAGNPLG